MAAGEPSDGVIDGDLFLVGGGDPLLATKPYVQHFQNQPQLRTSLEGLADRIVKAGVHQIKGRVAGDESRYDSDRYPDAWPARYAEQSQTGPLSALSVNDAFQAWPEHQSRRRHRREHASRRSTGVAVQQLISLLRARGVTVTGGPAAGTAPKDAKQSRRSTRCRCARWSTSS